MTSSVLTIRVAIATSFLARLRGLLGTSPNWGGGRCALLIPRCSSVHTIGMRYALDIAFIDGHGIVLRAERNVMPGHLLSCRGAAFALERPYDADAPWFTPHKHVELSACSAHERIAKTRDSSYNFVKRIWRSHV